MNRYEFINSNLNVKKLHEIGVTKVSLMNEMRVMKCFLSSTGGMMDRYAHVSVECRLSEQTVRRIVSFMSKSVS